MTLPYLGLSAAEFADIHEAVAEAMAFVVLPVQFYQAKADALDPLYGEAAGGEEGWEPYGPLIHASVKLTPSEEELTRRGLMTGAHLLMFIPKRHILEWEADAGMPFDSSQEGMAKREVAYDGVRYNVMQARTDKLPVGNGATADTIGPVVTARTKPSKGS